MIIAQLPLCLSAPQSHNGHPVWIECREFLMAERKARDMLIALVRAMTLAFTVRVCVFVPRCHICLMRNLLLSVSMTSLYGAALAPI